MKLTRLLGPSTSETQQPFSTSTSVWFTLSLCVICLGITAMLGFVGQCAMELPYHLSGKMAIATVGNYGSRENTANPVTISSVDVTVYYFTKEKPNHITAAKLKSVERLPQDARDALWSTGQILVVYVPEHTDEVMPKAVLDSAGQEIKSGVLGGSGIALPGIGMLLWLKKEGRLQPWW